MIEQAVRYSVMGRPGATYVEVAGDTLRDHVNGDIYYPPICVNPPMTPAPDTDVKRALTTLAQAKSPLIILGKGAAYADASPELTEFTSQANDRSAPMNYYCALGIINKHMPRDAVVMNEGSDTMDIGRTVLNNYMPRKRLDAGTWGTMGVGLGQAIAGALHCPNPGCVAVMGDSAFGFSGMELEVISRYELPVVIVIINNNGIGAMNPTDWQGASGTDGRIKYPAKSLTPSCHYEGMAQALGLTGVFCNTADQLEEAFARAVATKPFKPTLINCMINTAVSRAKEAAPPFAKSSL